MSTKEKSKEEKELDSFLKTFYELKKASKKKDFGFSCSWETFLKKTLFLSPKSRGTKIQNRIIKENGFISVLQRDDRGDFECKGKYFEIKTTLLDATNEDAQITGIRQYQDIEGYYIFIIDAKDYKKIETHCFYLSKKQMQEECDKNNAKPVSGSSKANKDNKNVVLRFSLPYKEDVFNNWKTKYTLSKSTNPCKLVCK